jgi:hypothetical protein
VCTDADQYAERSSRARIIQGQGRLSFWQPRALEPTLASQVYVIRSSHSVYGGQQAGHLLHHLHTISMWPRGGFAIMIVLVPGCISSWHCPTSSCRQLSWGRPGSENRWAGSRPQRECRLRHSGSSSPKTPGIYSACVVMHLESLPTADSSQASSQTHMNNFTSPCPKAKVRCAPAQRKRQVCGQ